MVLPVFTLSVILGLLLAEAQLSRRNEAELRARGAIAPPGDVYRLMAVVYPAAFVAMGLEGTLRAVLESHGSNAAGAQAARAGLYASGLLLFAASKFLKYWAMASLRSRWSFRVLVLPGLPLVTDGPYRYVAHPNYIAVIGELAGTAMMMTAWVSGPIALVAFGAILWVRVRFETAALRAAYQEIDRADRRAVGTTIPSP